MPILADIYFHLYEGSDEGQKPPVVLLHGAGGIHLYWPSDVRRLPGYRVYALDLPGHGKSAGRGHQSIHAYVQGVVGWLGQSGLHRAVFVGHSMGGAIAMSLAVDYPEHVIGLGLVGAGVRMKVSEALLESASSATTFHNAIDMVISWSFSSHAPERLVKLAAQRMAETRYSVLHGDFLACDGFDLGERVDEIRCPTLVICGEQDKMIPKRYAQFLADRIPNARLEVIQDAGHMVMLEQPRAVVGALMDFLRGIHY